MMTPKPSGSRRGRRLSHAEMAEHIDGLIARSHRFPNRLLRHNPMGARLKNIRCWLWQIARLAAMAPEKISQIKALYRGGRG